MRDQIGGKLRSGGLAIAALLAFQFGLTAQQESPNERIAVIIGFNQHPGPNEESLVRAAGGVMRHTYRIIPAIAATLPRRAVEALANHPAVSVIEPDLPVHALDEYSAAWGVAKIGSQTVHTAGDTGNGINVCIIDTGIDTSHPDLFANYAGGYDFVNNKALPSDDNGHGTHVAGSAAAALNGIGVVGVAPNARVFAYKVLDASGSGSFSNVIAALDKCQQDGGKITNNSYGSSLDPGTLVKAAFDNSYNAGILHVAAAGNAASAGSTCNSVSYPAKYGSVIAVAATDSGDRVATWSCQGAEVELSAPGAAIYSTYPPSTYATLSGTSMASPHVAGVAALVYDCGLTDLNGDGKVNNIDVRLRMQQTALDLGLAGRDPAYGFGRVQADKAALNCSSPPPATQPPAAPTNLAVTGTGRGSVSLAWTDNSNNETTFEVWRCTGAGCTNFALAATLSANTTSYTNTGLSRKTTYQYEVRATNSGGSSAFSNIVSAATR